MNEENSSQAENINKPVGMRWVEMSDTEYEYTRKNMIPGMAKALRIPEETVDACMRLDKAKLAIIGKKPQETVAMTTMINQAMQVEKQERHVEYPSYAVANIPTMPIEGVNNTYQEIMTVGWNSGMKKELGQDQQINLVDIDISDELHYQVLNGALKVTRSILNDLGLDTIPDNN